MLPIKTLDVKDAISIFEAVKYVAKEWELPLYIQNKTTQEKIAVDLVEFGRTMDATHRDTAYNIIDRIFSTNFDQIFLVSHFESMYGRFVNADIVQLEEA